MEPQVWLWLIMESEILPLPVRLLCLCFGVRALSVSGKKEQVLATLYFVRVVLYLG